jgi:hypothetical protein
MPPKNKRRKERRRRADHLRYPGTAIAIFLAHEIFAHDGWGFVVDDLLDCIGGGLWEGCATATGAI